MANADLGLEEKKKRIPTVEEAFGPEPVKGPEAKRIPTVEEAFGPEPKKPQDLSIPIASPWGRWGDIQKKSVEKAVKTGVNIATGLVPPLDILRPSWMEEYSKAPESKELPAGTLTGGEYTPEELARIEQEKGTKESMLGNIAGRSLMNIILGLPGGPAETAIGGGLKLAGKTISPIVEKGIEVLPPWMRRGPGSFKTKAEEVLENVKVPYRKVAAEAKPAVVKPPVAKAVGPSPEPKEVAPVPPKVKMPPRKGAETEIGELKNIEGSLYQRAEATTPKAVKDKINVETYNEYLSKFTDKKNQSFGRLKPPEKKEIRGVINQIQKEINPEVRAGMRGRVGMSEEELAEMMTRSEQTGRGFTGEIGAITEPGTFTSARATRSWLSEEAADAFSKGNKNLGAAYRELRKALENDLEKSVGKEPWAAWKEADSFKTRRHLMDEVFGPKVESRPGKYDFKKIKKNLDKISTERFESAGFSEKEINAMRKISDASSWRLTIENHPSLKMVIPWIVAEMIGTPVPPVSPLRHAASLTHVVPGGGLGGY